jgi:DNA polymerase III epsilon subunit family exonuclease
MGYEYVDAESPEWPPRGEPSVQERAATPDEVEPLEQLRQRVVERARRELRDGSTLLASWETQPLEATPFCVVDLETTGPGDSGQDEIVEIGAVQLDGFEWGREFATLVDPRRPISRAARSVHGIGDVDVWTAPRLEHALPWLLETVRDRVLVFHNAAFDLGFLQRALLETGRNAFKQPVLDTLQLARRLTGGRCSLSSLAQRFRIEAKQPHRALSDARVTAHLAVELLSSCARAGATQLGQIPGVAPRPLRPRSRVRRHDALAERLELAVRRQERLRLSYHAAAGVEPVLLEIHPLRLLGALHLVAHDCLRDQELLLELVRIGTVRSC